jgi:hypothetical protein
MRIGGYIFGLIVVLIGTALLLDNLGISGDVPIGEYWPVLLIALGFFGWVGKRFVPELGSMVLMTLGGILLTQNLSDDKSFGDLWPALVIAIGISIIFGRSRRKGCSKKFGMRFQKGRNWGDHGHGRFRNRDRDKSSHDVDEFFSGSERQVDGE